MVYWCNHCGENEVAIYGDICERCTDALDKVWAQYTANGLGLGYDYREED